MTYERGKARIILAQMGAGGQGRAAQAAKDWGKRLRLAAAAEGCTGLGRSSWDGCHPLPLAGALQRAVRMPDANAEVMVVNALAHVEAEAGTNDGTASMVIVRSVRACRSRLREGMCTRSRLPTHALGAGRRQAEQELTAAWALPRAALGDGSMTHEACSGRRPCKGFLTDTRGSNGGWVHRMVGDDAIENSLARVAWHIRGWASLQRRRHDGLCAFSR